VPASKATKSEDASARESIGSVGVCDVRHSIIIAHHTAAMSVVGWPMFLAHGGRMTFNVLAMKAILIRTFGVFDRPALIESCAENGHAHNAANSHRVSFVYPYEKGFFYV
jgi:hypothetical protein